MIHFIEGTLASGKTTLAEKLFDSCRRAGKTAALYCEHDASNPLDFTNRAFLDTEEFTRLKARLTAAFHSHYGEDYAYGLHKLEQSTQSFAGGLLVHIPTLASNDDRINRELAQLESFQLCNGVLPKERYMELLTLRWAAYAASFVPETESFFEGALLQNPLLDLIGWYQLSLEELRGFYKCLTGLFPPHNYAISFIHVSDIPSALSKAGRERNNSRVPWIESFVAWVEHTPYGQARCLTGFDGAVSFSETIQNAGLLLLECCEAPYSVIERKA